MSWPLRLQRFTRFIVVAGLVVAGCTASQQPTQTVLRKSAVGTAKGDGPVAKRAAALPTVAIITTGGTIAMSPDEQAGGAVPTLSGEALVAAVPELRELASLRVVPLCNIDSREMTPELWLAQARLVNKTLADPEVVGVVVTHGTDTMEESAYFLDRTVISDKPVVMTGAQRDATARDADGPRNLLNAVRQVLDVPAGGRGVTITLNGRIVAARNVTKIHASNVAAFGAGHYGQLGEIDGEGVTWFNRPERRQVAPLPDALPRVDLIACYPGADGSLIDAAVESGARGIVVAGYGLGNVNRPTFDAIKRARQAGVAVALTTRVPAGRVYPAYGGEGGGSSMRELGVIFANDLSPWKARIELMLALARGGEPDELQRCFDQR
jgi:L-asparaginase